MPIQPEMLHEKTVTMSPEFNQFVLSDTGLPSRTLPSRPITNIAVTATGGALFLTNTDTAELSVTVEVWSSTPPAATSAWDREVHFTVTFGTLRPTLASVTASPGDRQIELPRAGTYEMEVYRNESLSRDTDFDLDIGLQTWLIRLWPDERQGQVRLRHGRGQDGVRSRHRS